MLRSFAIASSVAFLCAQPASSSTIAGQFGGTFAAPTDHTGATFVYDGEGSSALRWGSPSGPSQTVETGNASVMTISSGAFSHATSVNGEYLLGSVTWENQSNWYSGGIWNSILTLNLAVNTATGLSTRSVDVNFSIDNTTDEVYDTATNEVTGNNPDVVAGFTLSDGDFGAPIDLGNGWVFSDLLFRLDNAGTSGTNVTTATGDTLIGTSFGSIFDDATGAWTTREGTTATIGIYANLTAVPLPAGLWLLLSGLTGVFMIGRQQKAQA